METAILLLLGLAIGSFVGAVTWRLKKSIPISKGRSFCDNCKTQINWYDNIPVFSFLFLKGRCRHCHQKINPLYPIIEIIFAISFLGVWFFLPSIKNNISFLNLNFLVLPYLLFVISLLLGIFVTDFKYQLIFDQMSFGLFIGTILLMLLISYGNLYAALFSGFLAGSFLLLINLLTKGRGMGLGDVKLALFGGVFLGLPLLPIWMSLSFVIGAIVGLFLILFKKTEFGSHIAFGPFMIVSLILCSIFGKLISSLIF